MSAAAWTGDRRPPPPVFSGRPDLSARPARGSAPGRLIANVGGFYSGTLGSVNLSLRVRPHARLTLESDWLRNDVALPRAIEGGVSRTTLVITRAVFAFSNRSFVRGLFQIDTDENETCANIVFRYTYRPGSDLFVVYNEDDGAAHVRRRQILVKATLYVLP